MKNELLGLIQNAVNELFKENDQLKKDNEILIEALKKYSHEEKHGFTAREALKKIGVSNEK